MTVYLKEYSGIAGTLKGDIQLADESQLITEQQKATGTVFSALNARTRYVKIKSDADVHYVLSGGDATTSNDYLTADTDYFFMVDRGANWIIDTVAKS